MFDGVADVLIAELDAANERVARAQRELLGLIARAAKAEIWRDTGARDLAHWLSMRYGISSWKAHRWITAAEALEDLPTVEFGLQVGCAEPR